MELVCVSQNYAWGKVGSASTVAKLLKTSSQISQIDESKPYAELWMGTHPNGPSKFSNGDLLSSSIESDSTCLGSKITSKFGNQLPFLFKVLSVDKALSIQAHPNKKHAEELHAARPDVYKDPNHKPEMTVALTPFVALCGFKPSSQIVDAFNELSELRSLIGEGPAMAFCDHPTEENLKICFKNLMMADKEEISQKIASLAQVIRERKSPLSGVENSELFLDLVLQYPGDVGCFSVFFLNVLHVEPGQAMFLGPNIPHAYLKGDCIECMACSDNVVRAGLTPKYKDVETLISMLDYSMTEPKLRFFQADKVDDFCQVFDPPVPDFAVETISVTSGNSYSLRVLDSASILIVVEASEIEICSGKVFFIRANSNFELKATNSNIKAFRAFIS